MHQTHIKLQAVTMDILKELLNSNRAFEMKHDANGVTTFVVNSAANAGSIAIDDDDDDVKFVKEEPADNTQSVPAAKASSRGAAPKPTPSNPSAKAPAAKAEVKARGASSKRAQPDTAGPSTADQNPAKRAKKVPEEKKPLEDATTVREVCLALGIQINSTEIEERAAFIKYMESSVGERNNIKMLSDAILTLMVFLNKSEVMANKKRELHDQLYRYITEFLKI